jgi:hypothetical protein
MLNFAGARGHRPVYCLLKYALLGCYLLFCYLLALSDVAFCSSYEFGSRGVLPSGAARVPVAPTVGLTLSNAANATPVRSNTFFGD